MKNIKTLLALFITIFLLSYTSNTAQNNTVKISKSQITKYEHIFKDLKEYLSEENGKLWNRQLYGPILLVDKNSRTIFANMPDDKGILKKKGKIYVGILPKEINISNTAHNWNGKRWTMVMLPLPKDYNERLNLLTHELFHRIQPELGFKNLNNKAGNHLDDLNARVFLKLELEALKKALRSKNVTGREKHIQNALFFRNYRDELYPGEKEEENALEMNEGLAEYTGSTLSDRTDIQLKEHYIEAINRFYNNKTFVRSFAYVTIPVYGYFMKMKNQNWNKEITVKTNLTDYITKFFNVSIPINPSEFKAIINKIKNNYGFEKIKSFETNRANERKKLIAKYEIEFLKNPTLTIYFENMNISFDPRNIMPFKDLGTVYPNIRITDNWGILTVKNGALLSKNWDKVIISKPIEITNKTAKGDGWKLELNNGWQVEQTGKNYILKRK